MPKVHCTAGPAHVYIDLFQSVHINTIQPLLRESKFAGAIELCHSELPYLLFPPFLVPNAGLSFQTAPHWLKSAAAMWEYNKEK